MSVEKTILNNLVVSEKYARKVLPFLKPEYFESRQSRILFEEINSFVTEYNSLPTRESLDIELNQRKDINGDEFKSLSEELDLVYDDTETPTEEWLLNQTENFCKDRAIYNAIMESIHVIDGKSDKTVTALPDILSEALAVSFDTHIGHDYLDNVDDRYDFYHRVETKIPFDLEFMNKITDGGVPKKTLNVILAGTGVGKSLAMCHHAANCLSQNRNVLYITCEMAEERIAERIDANLMNTSLNELRELPRDIYNKKFSRSTDNIKGKLIVKEYPTATASVVHFKNLLDELKLKKNFKPDIIFIDYLNICASSRFKSGAAVNSYTYIKAIAEELRGLAVQYDLPIFTATQTNRQGFANTDVDLTDTSESFGLPATADFMVALISNEELEELDQIMVKQLKNRYNDPSTNRKFVIGIDRSKMKLYDLETSAQNGLIDTGQDYGERFSEKFDKNTQEYENWNF